MNKSLVAALLLIGAAGAAVEVGLPARRRRQHQQRSHYYQPGGLSVAEGETAVTTVGERLNGDSLTYSLSGEDGALFNISSSSVLVFRAAPDYDAPQDADQNNVYSIWSAYRTAKSRPLRT